MWFWYFRRIHLRPSLLYLFPCRFSCIGFYKVSSLVLCSSSHIKMNLYTIWLWGFNYPDVCILSSIIADSVYTSFYDTIPKTTTQLYRFLVREKTIQKFNFVKKSFFCFDPEFSIYMQNKVIWRKFIELEK